MENNEYVKLNLIEKNIAELLLLYNSGEILYESHYREMLSKGTEIQSIYEIAEIYETLE